MRIPASLLSGVAGAVLAAIPLAFFGHGLRGFGGWTAPASLLIGTVLAALVWRWTPATPSPSPRSPWDWLLIVLFCCASGRAFFWLIYSDGDQWKILSPNNLGDLSLHLSLIRWLAGTVSWWPASPILAGDPLRYPPGSDLFNSLLLVAGVPVDRGLLWCGLGGAALTGVALWRWGGAVALAAFLFNGGFAGAVLLRGTDPDSVAEWKNLFLTLFVTQRGFLFALPAGLLLLSAWREEVLSAVRCPVLPLPVQALLLAVLPLFSVHAALFLGVVMSGLVVMVPGARKRMLSLAALSWPVMALLGWLVTSGAGGPSALASIRWSPGWMGDGSLGFWFWNFGIALPMTLLLCLVLLPRNRGTGHSVTVARAFVLSAALVFAACLLIRFAPWPWDNTKLMLWSWLVVAPFLWSVLLERRPFVVRVVAVMLLFGSGVVTLLAGLDGRHGYVLIKRSSVDRAESLLRDLPPDAVIACAPEFNHPVLISGHPVVCGYEGHLWSHGLDYSKRLALLNDIMNGREGWREKARSLGVSRIYWSDLEAVRWPDSKLPWAKEVASPSLHRVE
jgi:hypothetical protein